VQLKNGSNEHEGRVEIAHAGQWGTICDDEFGVEEADVICRSLGYVSGLPTGSEQFGYGVGRIWLDDVACVGNEDSLEQCRHREWGYYDCSHMEVAGVICSE
ncbi:hypothetical protein CAPTEDRAFT_142319, partial [Capitella teleta]